MVATDDMRQRLPTGGHSGITAHSLAAVNSLELAVTVQLPYMRNLLPD